MRQMLARILLVPVLLVAMFIIPQSAAASAAAAAAVSVRHSSVMFAIDQDHHSVVMFTRGRAPQTVVKGLTAPASIAVDTWANVYIVDEGTHQLLKANIHNGQKSVLRSNLGALMTSMALDDKNNLYIHDRTSVLKYSSSTHKISLLGNAPGPAQMPGTGSPGQLTVDGAGNASVTSQSLSPADELQGVTVKTFPATGGPPTSRTVHSSGGLSYFLNAVESRSGTLYIQTFPPSVFQIQTVFRLEPGSSTALAVVPQASMNAVAVDPHNNFFLMQIRQVCPPQDFGCQNNYAVDSISKFAPGASTPTVRPVTDLQLPAGGMAISIFGTIYGAVIASQTQQPNTDVPPEIVRLDVGATKPVVLARGHFLMPTPVTYSWIACG